MSGRLVARSCCVAAVALFAALLEATELERILEHFVSSKKQGLGMGLAISRSIVEAHDGRIWASRNAGRGLTVAWAAPPVLAAPPGRGGPRPAGVESRIQPH
jgi:light-regulated signal transduction histidine kinase (bacteriophytochrome)